MPVPFELVTATSTVPAACGGGVTVTVVGSTATRLAAGTPPNVTALAPVKPAPLMVTLPPPPRKPVPGLTDSTVGFWAKIHAAPTPSWSPLPADSAVLPSAESATGEPCDGISPTQSVPTSLLPCCVQVATGLTEEPVVLRVNTHAAPMKPLSDVPPTMAVLPSPDSATDEPWPIRGPAPPVPTSFACCTHSTTLPPSVKTVLRANTQAAPFSLLSESPPTMAVLPSPDSATEVPCPAVPTALLPMSFGPCTHATVPGVRANTHAAPMPLLS